MSGRPGGRPGLAGRSVGAGWSGKNGRGKTAIVTGGASGIGGGISRRLAADGTAVAIFDRDGSAAKAAATSIEEAGGKAIGLLVDVTDRAGIDAGLDEVRARLGRPAILVNSAGITVYGPV